MIPHLARLTLHTQFDPATGRIAGGKSVERHLADLRGCFADTDAYMEALARTNPLVYAVDSVEPAAGPGDLHYGIGRLMPGRIGSEYFLTKGHLHSCREAAEIYLGLAGEGVMLLEDEATGATRMLSLKPHEVVYVPGHTAHRTINIGNVTLVYAGIYPANAGHDYGVIAQRNFRFVVVERNGIPTLLPRDQLPG